MDNLKDFREIERLLKEKFPHAINVKSECFGIKYESVIGRFRLKFDNGKTKKVWTKTKRVFLRDQDKGRQAGKNAYDVLIKLYNSFAREDNLSVVKPLGYIPSLGAVITENVPGVSLHKIVFRYISYLNRLFFFNKESAENILFDCGQWLVKLQEATSLNREIRGVELYFLQEADIEKDLSHLEQIGVAKNAIDKLRQYFFRNLPLIKNLSFRAVGCHIDFSHRNILVSRKGKIVGLDFEDFSYRWPYDNVAMFMAYLDTIAKYPFIDRNKLNKLKSFFLEGYKKKSEFTVDDKILHFFHARYITLMIANELIFTKKLKGIFRWIILRRMSRVLENWVNENIIQDNQKMKKFNNERSLEFWIHGTERGRKMVSFLDNKIGSLEQKKVLDVGCGGGGISIAFAERCREVVTLDTKIENINLVKKRIGERGLKTIRLLESNALYLPFSKETFDIVIMNGVLEWVGYGTQENPLPLQTKALDEAFRVLKEKGVLYLAIENRWYPFNILRDPHAHIPLVAVLPQKIANRLSLLLTNKPYETPIYSYWKLNDLLKNRGFSKISMFAPLTNYQYPVVIVNLEKKGYRLSKEQINMISYEYKKMKLTRRLKLKLLFLKLIFSLGVPKIFVHGFIALAYKNKEKNEHIDGY